MNGAPTPLTAAASAAPAAPQANAPRRRRPQTSSVLRTPHRPLKKIARPVTSLTHLNERSVDNKPINTEVLRNELLAQGAHSYPLIVTRKDLKELRYHVMRLQSKDRVDIQDDQQFTTPVRLHRRDPRAPPTGAGAGAHLEGEEDTKEDVEEAKERERMEIAREERRKIREENQAKIAPTGTKKPPAFQKKTEQKWRPDDTVEAKKRQLLRYEETLPWHLEDYDNKQTWTGTYESEMSETHVMLTPENVEGRGTVFKLVPLERWYRFNPKTKAKSTDDISLAKSKADTFFIKRELMNRVKEEQATQANRAKGMRTRVGGGDDDEGRIHKVKTEGPMSKAPADADDIDFNMEEDFADDEEGVNGLFEGDHSDVEEAKEKLKRDQLAAAAFDLRSEEQIYEEEERQKKEEEEAKALEKGIKKALIKREKNYRFNLSSDDESESDTDSEVERRRVKAEEEQKAAEKNGKTVEGDKPASGASTKAAPTPSGASRPVDINKKKRPGSPNLSEASGNESSHKKHKKKHERNADGSRKSSSLNDISKRGAASGSDSEMTDAGKQKQHKIKIHLNATPGGSPSGSRAGSPAAQVNGSRAGSPTAPGTNLSASQSRFPSAAELYKALPPEGMKIDALIGKFKGRVDKSNTQLFIRLVKAVSSYDKQRSWLTPLKEMPSEEQINAVMRGQKAAPKAAGSS